MLPSVSERTEPVSSVASEALGMTRPPEVPKSPSPIRSFVKRNTPTLLIKDSNDREREYIRLKGPVYILKSDLLSKSVSDTEKSEEARLSASGIPDKSVTPLKNVCIVMPVKSETESSVSVEEEQETRQKKFLKASDSLALGAFKPQNKEVEEEEEEEIVLPEKEQPLYHYLMVDVSTETKRSLEIHPNQFSVGLKEFRGEFGLFRVILRYSIVF